MVSSHSPILAPIKKFWLCTSGLKWYKDSAKTAETDREPGHEGTRGVQMMKMWLACCTRGSLILLLTASAVLTASGVWAQGTAQLSGTVRDESGGVLPGVSVTVTQTNTGLVRTTVTESNGAYLLTNLPTGPYRLEAALQGFKTYAQTGIVLQVGGTPTSTRCLPSARWRNPSPSTPKRPSLT
jgi:hypothetical protein